MFSAIGKFLFPRLQPDQQRREMFIILAAIVVGLVFAGIVTLVILVKANFGH
jgi:hypothetical protein